MDVIEKVTGEMKVHTVGYCVGGTLLASTLAWLAEKRRQRVTSATFFAAQVDFTHAGDLLVFVDEDQISALERDMQAAGVLEGSKMAMAFNMLRSNDLIWSYVVSNYLKGQPPSPFDLLHWNSDATRMPAANHSFYLRNCYLENRLSTGSMVLDNTLLDLSKVKVPVYNLATREDHIAPAESVLYGSQFFGGPVKYVLSGSGHIAGVVNPPAGGKYQYWTNDNIRDVTLADWLKNATEHKGSWWPDWRAMAGEPRRRARARARRRLRGAAADRGRARQLRQGPRIAPSRHAVRYNQPSRRRDSKSFEGEPMTRELFWLTLTVILTGLMWVPYIINRCQVRGLTGAMANPSRNDKPQADWANRLMFAHDNAVENLDHLRAAGPDPQRPRLFHQMDRAGLRRVFLVPRRASDRLHAGPAGVPHAGLHRRLPGAGRAGAGRTVTLKGNANDGYRRQGTVLVDADGDFDRSDVDSLHASTAARFAASPAPWPIRRATTSRMPNGRRGMMFAHDNAVENLIIFAPLVLILNAIDYSTKWTVLACAVYFWSRVAHLIVYTLGLPVFRTLAFTVGFLAQAVLALAIFKVV